jgi:hypothetical protein
MGHQPFKHLTSGTFHQINGTNGLVLDGVSVSLTYLVYA